MTNEQKLREALQDVEAYFEIRNLGVAAEELLLKVRESLSQPTSDEGTPLCDAVRERFKAAAAMPNDTDEEELAQIQAYNAVGADIWELAEQLERTLNATTQKLDRYTRLSESGESLGDALDLLEALHAKERELADKDTVPRSRYNACNQDWLNAKAELKEVRAIAADEIKRLIDINCELTRQLVPSVSAAPQEGWQHIANEYADAVANAIVWLRNIRDGISLATDALPEMESNLKRIRALQPAPQEGKVSFNLVELVAPPPATPRGDGGEKMRALLEQHDDETLANALKLIEQGKYPSPQSGKKEEWISVKERLPDLQKMVLLHSPQSQRGAVQYGFYGFKGGSAPGTRDWFVWTTGGWEEATYTGKPVTYWMPLPSPPASKGNKITGCLGIKEGAPIPQQDCVCLPCEVARERGYDENNQWSPAP